MGKQKKETKIVYSCGVDWRHEINEAPDLEGKMPLYSSIKALKKAGQCWKECGIVKLEITVKEWVEPQNLFKNNKKEK